MKILRAEKGKGLDLKPCLNCVPVKIKEYYTNYVYTEKRCPCSNFSGEKQMEGDNITVFACENRKMHQPPKSKEANLPPTGTSNERSKRKAT